jgi:hypothetical protein
MKSLVRLAVNVIQRLVAPGSCILLAHGMRNEFALRSRTGVRASFLALTCAWGTEGISSRQTETTAELIGWGPRSAVCLPDAFSRRWGSA